MVKKINGHPLIQYFTCLCGFSTMVKRSWVLPIEWYSFEVVRSSEIRLRSHFTRYLFVAPRKTATAWGGKNRSHTPGRADKHTSNKDPTSYRGAVSTLTSISHTWIFVSFLVGSSPRSYLFTSATGWVRVFTLLQGMEQILSDIRRYTFEIGAVQHRSVTEIAPPRQFLCVNRSPISGTISVPAQKLLSGKVWT